jgi:hypothetical protein
MRPMRTDQGGLMHYFRRRPGTLAIMKILMLTYQSPREIPSYAHLIRRRQEHKQVDVRLRGSSWTLTIFGSIGAIASLYGVLCAGCAGLGLLTVLLAAVPFNETTVIGFAVMGILFLAVGGIAMIGTGVSRVIAGARTRRAWDLMLMLPHPRHEVILYLIAPAYSPGLLIVSLSVIEIFTLGPLALQKSNYFGWWLILLVALTVEWMQITALTVSVGMLSARGGLSYSLPLLFGMVWIIARAGAGALVALLMGVPAMVFLFAGPVNGIAVSHRWPVGVVIATLYLLALEIGVRWSFARAVARAGE